MSLFSNASRSAQQNQSAQSQRSRLNLFKRSDSTSTVLPLHSGRTASVVPQYSSANQGQAARLRPSALGASFRNSRVSASFQNLSQALTPVSDAVLNGVVSAGNSELAAHFGRAHSWVADQLDPVVYAPSSSYLASMGEVLTLVANNNVPGMALYAVSNAQEVVAERIADAISACPTSTLSDQARQDLHAAVKKGTKIGLDVTFRAISLLEMRNAPPSQWYAFVAAACVYHAAKNMPNHTRKELAGAAQLLIIGLVSVNLSRHFQGDSAHAAVEPQSEPIPEINS